MTEIEFEKAFQIAQNMRFTTNHGIEEENEALTKLSGCGLPGGKCTCSLKDAAYLINYQALTFNGVYDAEMLDSIREALLTNVSLERQKNH